MKKLFLCALLWLFAVPSHAQLIQYSPGQLLTAAALNSNFSSVLPISGGILTGPLTVPSLSVTGSPIGLASGGTNCSTVSGTCLDNITGFSSTGFLERTGSGAYTFVADPLPVAHGGTGSATATGATSNLQYLQGATGSGARSLTNKLQDTISVLDFTGVDPTGTTDSSAGINNACGTGKSFYFPPGSYLYSGSCTLATGQVASGAGRNASIIKSNAAAATLFTAAGQGSGIHDIGFSANVTQTGGSYVVLSGTECYISDFSMTGDFNGVTMIGSVDRIRHGRFLTGASGATRIFAGGGDNSQIIDDVLMGAQSPQIARAGIEVKNSYALIIGHVSVLQQGIGLLIDPTQASENVGSLYVHDSFFDTNSGPNIKINPTGTGTVVRSRFANVWAGDGAADGVSIVNGGTGVVSGIHFIDPHLMLNTGSGITTGGTVSDLSIIGGEVAQNSYGMYFNAAITGLVIGGAAIGNVGGMNGNTNAAIVIAGAGTNQINIHDNNLCGNGSVLSDSSGSVSSKIIKGNNCYNPIASTSITVTASPFTYTNNTGDTVNVFVTGGAVSSVTLGGNTVATATNTVVPVPQGASVVVTYSSAPTMTYIGY